MMEFVSSLYISARERLAESKGGQTLVEYSLVLTCVAVALAGAFELYGQNLYTVVSGLDSSIISP
jgi:Flp pilus assembly pilin Flp